VLQLPTSGYRFKNLPFLDYELETIDGRSSIEAIRVHAYVLGLIISLACASLMVNRESG